MPMIYSDVEVTAKVCMDPESMYNAMRDIKRMSEHASFNSSVVARLLDEMHSVLLRLAEMHCLPIDIAEQIMRVEQ